MAFILEGNLHHSWKFISLYNNVSKFKVAILCSSSIKLSAEFLQCTFSPIKTLLAQQADLSLFLFLVTYDFEINAALNKHNS